MEENSPIRRFENAHIVLWLIKDTCWMMNIRILGAIMIIPTLLMAIYIVRRTRHTHEFALNLAVMFWIMANSYWMLVEFFFADSGKIFALVPFSAGLLCVTWYYIKILRQKQA